jgi:glutamate-5-semialdehyde dehydrogenase
MEVARKQLYATRNASQQLTLLTDEQIYEALTTLAQAIIDRSAIILEANAADLEHKKKDDPMYDRMMLNEERLQGIAEDIRNVAALPSPLGRVLSQTVRPNGLKLTKVSVPFGVIGVIYEARPNVTLDVFALCFKSGSACALKGSMNIYETNIAIVETIRSVLSLFGINPNTVSLLPPQWEAINVMLNAEEYIDLIIPRGGHDLINLVRKNSTVPVIETGAGICHTYFDAHGDICKGAPVIRNAKTRRVSVCNALDCLIIHRERLIDLPMLCYALAEKKVMIYADTDALTALTGHYPAELLKPATNESYGTEFLSYAMSIKTVDDTEEAIAHITRYGSKHSECIITESKEEAQRFTQLVDAACVYINASTAFTDGAQFGLGAEIGISTQKLHARGPMGLKELTTYKWIVEGEGQVRNK